MCLGWGVQDPALRRGSDSRSAPCHSPRIQRSSGPQHTVGGWWMVVVDSGGYRSVGAGHGPLALPGARWRYLFLGRRSVDDGVPLNVCPCKAVYHVVVCSATAQASVLRSSNLFLEEPNRFHCQFDLAVSPTANIINAVHCHVLLCMLVLIEIATVGEHRDYADRGSE
jgi:hypothetical protein